MKYIYKNIVLLFSLTAIVLTSCETLDLDKTTDPNFLLPSQADPNFLLNNIQEDFVRQIAGNADGDPQENFSGAGGGLSTIGLTLTRLNALTSSRVYENAFAPSSLDDEWTNAYSGLLTDIKTLIPLAQENQLPYHVAIAQFIEAYLMTAMVDFFGDVPYSEAIQGLENLTPALDSGASIYDAALTLLDNSIINFEASDSNGDPLDLFYANDYDKWINAANTLKMRLYNQRRLVDSDAITNINAILNTGNYIQSTADDLQFNWPATSSSQPDTRHPAYGINYSSVGADGYASNWLMNLMDTTNDPRKRYYFFRQTDCTPGASCDPEGDEENLACSLTSAPAHYVSGGFTFCYLENGYWGRDHADDAGGPPDGFLKTTFGVYPAGGKFDDDRFADDDDDNDGATLGSGGGGRGITPILTAAWVDYMRAEIALSQMNTGDAQMYLVEGLTKQISKVQSFGSIDPNANLTVFAPTATAVSNYISDIENAFSSATSPEDRWNVFSEQFLIATYANGIEAYNFYRRTGFPTTLQPTIEADPGDFPRSLFYPSNAVNTNSNITQKSSLSIPVFWDNNTSGPIAN